MGCISKFGLLIINFLVVAVGISVTGVSAALIEQNSHYGYFLSSIFFSMPIMTLVTGIFLACVGILGCIGTIKENPILLKIYAVVLTVLLVLVLVAGIMLLVVATNTAQYLVAGMIDIFSQYGQPGKETVTHDLDIVQNELECCGVLGYNDWEEFSYGNWTNVADGCCRNHTKGCGEDILLNPNVEDLIYTIGCATYIGKALEVTLLALGILTIALVCIQIMCIIWACLLAKDSTKKYKTFEIRQKEQERKY